MITAYAHARAGLVGNPSDGYFGKTISFIIRNYRATVTLTPSDHFEIKPGPSDLCSHKSVAEFLRDQKLFGYYGGMRLIKAAVKRFHNHCAHQGIKLETGHAFTLSYDSDIPRLVGMSGSSAIVTATMRALLQFYNVSLPKPYLPTLVRSVEQDELGITCGLQDRVIQTYEGMVYMDFEKSQVESLGYGKYEELNPNPRPPIYVAFDPERAEISDVPHRNLKKLWLEGDATVHAAMKELADLTERGRAALLSGDWKTMHKVVDGNYAVRQKIMAIAPENHRMVEAARSVGCSSHFCGSGGAVCGLYDDESQFNRLDTAMKSIGCTVIKPEIF
jgi:glucuronokinase